MYAHFGISIVVARICHAYFSFSRSPFHRVALLLSHFTQFFYLFELNVHVLSAPCCEQGDWCMNGWSEKEITMNWMLSFFFAVRHGSCRRRHTLNFSSLLSRKCICRRCSSNPAIFYSRCESNCPQIIFNCCRRSVFARNTIVSCHRRFILLRCTVLSTRQSVVKPFSFILCARSTAGPEANSGSEQKSSALKSMAQAKSAE